jgi:DNA polymerase III subunit epsilon
MKKTIENVLILDTETTGIEPCQGGLIEIGAIFYNVPTKSIIQQFSTLLHAEENPAFEINRISTDSLKATICEIEVSCLGLLLDMIKFSDLIIAHNADFDKNWLKTLECLKSLKGDFIPDYKKWLCTRNDFTWPILKATPLNLIHIAVALGVPIVSAHRALTDCQLIASCFNKIDDLEERLIEAQKERHIYIAQVSFQEKKLAKAEGFIWNELYKNYWAKKMTDSQASAMRENSKFKIAKVTNDTKPDIP